MKELYEAFDQISRSVGEKIEAWIPAYEAIDRLFFKLDQGTRDRLTTEFWFFSNQFGPDNSLGTPQAKGWVRHWFSLLRQGEKAPFAEYATRNCDGFNFVVEGGENLVDKPGIYVSNHPCGPMLGTWYVYAIDYAIFTKFKSLDFVPRRFVNEFSESYLLGETPLRHLKERACQMMAHSTNGILIKRDRSTFSQVLIEGLSHLESGGSLAACFETQNSNRLTRPRKGMGGFLRLISKDGHFPIIPVGCWKEGDNLNVNFGGPVDIKGFLESLPAEIPDKIRSQRTIDYVVAHVASLLPEENRGVYKKFVR